MLPQITQLLESLNQPLPFYTRVIIGLSDFAPRLVVGAAGLLLSVRAPRRRTERGPGALRPLHAADARSSAGVVRLLAISRFTRTLSTLLAGGIPIVRALEISKHVANNA